MHPDEIKKIRNSLGLSQEKFAHYIGVVMSTVNRWEQGKAQPMPFLVTKIRELGEQIDGKKKEI